MNKRVESVLFVTTSFPRFSSDFAGSFVFRFAKYLARDGLQVTVLAPGAAGYPTTDVLEKIQVYRFSYFYPKKLQGLAYKAGILANLRQSWLAKIQVPFFFLATTWAILCHQDRFDLIHCHWLPTAVAALIVRLFSRTKPPIVFTAWGSDMRFLPTWLSRWAVRQVDGCISHDIVIDQNLQTVGRTEYRRIAAPVDEERFRRASVPASLRNELGIDEKIPIITFVGRLNYFEDPLTFIRACAILKKQNVSFMALMAGDGDLMFACQQEVQQNHLHDYIFLLGMRSDTEKLYKIATVTVNISPIENVWANVIAEAMFMEVPVILSDAGYTEQVFTHQKDCLIVPAQNPVALAKSLKCLMEEETLSKKLIAGARELLHKHKKDSTSIVQETRTYYDDLLVRR